jgi:hypothetical protein
VNWYGARGGGGAVSWAATESWAGLFWIGLIGALAVLYALPTIIALLRRAEGIAMVVILNVLPVAWPAALVAALMMPRRDDR